MKIKILSIVLCCITLTTHASTVIFDNYTNKQWNLEITSSGLCPMTQVIIKPAQRNISTNLGPTCSVKAIQINNTSPAVKYTEVTDDSNKNFRVSILSEKAMIVASKNFVEKVFLPSFDLEAFVKEQGYKNLSVEKDSGVIVFKK